MDKVQSDYVIDGNKFTRVDTLDVDPLLKQNAIERNSGQNDSSKSNMRKFASVDVVTLERLRLEQGIDWRLFGVDADTTVKMLAWFKDRDNRKFRTSEANLGDASRFV